MDNVHTESRELSGITASASESLFSEMLDRVKEVAHDIDERVHHALDGKGQTDA
jgi:hypothetical protein